MKIILKLFLTYKPLLPAHAVGSECEIEVESGSKPVEILAQFGVPVTEETVILINGRTPADPESSLCEGDVLCAFPVAAGG